MVFYVKVCGNQKKDMPKLLELMTKFQERQKQLLGEQEINFYAGLLVGQQHASDDFISLGEACGIIDDAPDDSVIVVTHLDEHSELIDLSEATQKATLQLHSMSPNLENIRDLRELYPQRGLWHVIHGNGGANTVESAVQSAVEVVEAGIDTILLDSRTVDRAGGTGILVPMGLARKFVNLFNECAEDVPVVLAGGLRPGNVGERVRIVRPRGVDANSGLKKLATESDKDMGKIEQYYEEVIEAVYSLRVSGA